MSQEYQKLPYILIWVLSLDFYDKNDRIRIEKGVARTTPNRAV